MASPQIALKFTTAQDSVDLQAWRRLRCPEIQGQRVDVALQKDSKVKLLSSDQSAGVKRG